MNGVVRRCARRDVEELYLLTGIRYMLRDKVRKSINLLSDNKRIYQYYYLAIET